MNFIKSIICLIYIYRFLMKTLFLHSRFFSIFVSRELWLILTIRADQQFVDDKYSR